MTHIKMDGASIASLWLTVLFLKPYLVVTPANVWGKDWGKCCRTRQQSDKRQLSQQNGDVANISEGTLNFLGL